MYKVKQMYVIFDDSVSTDEFLDIKDKLFAEVEAIPAEGEGVWKNQDFTSMSLSSNEISYTLYSEDLDDLMAAVKDYEAALAAVNGVVASTGSCGTGCGCH